MDVLISGAVDGVDGAAAQLQPLTIEQERHHVEKVKGEQASVGGQADLIRSQKGAPRSMEKSSKRDSVKGEDTGNLEAQAARSPAAPVEVERKRMHTAANPANPSRRLPQCRSYGTHSSTDKSLLLLCLQKM